MVVVFIDRGGGICCNRGGGICCNLSRFQIQALNNSLCYNNSNSNNSIPPKKPHLNLKIQSMKFLYILKKK